MRKNTIKKTADIILIIGIIIAVVLLFARAVNYPSIKHDEGISYLAATGHQELYETSKPSDKWVTASEWQAFWKIDKVGIFRTITRGLNTWDLHPPLYYWILNVWSGIFGINTTTGALLNIPFNVLISLMIFLICRGQKYPPIISAAAAVLWMVRYSIIEASIITRQYSLLGFIVLCFYYSLIRFLHKQSPINTFWLFLTSLLGFLTHYQFVVLMGIALAWVSIYFFLQKNLGPTLKIVSSSVGAILIFFVANPGFFQSVSFQQKQALPIRLFHSAVPYLIYRSFYNFAKLFLLEIITISKYSKIYMVIFAFILLGIFLYFIRKLSLKTMISRIFDEKNFILVTSFLTLMTIVVLYVIRVFAVQTMGVKNLMLLSPLLYIALAQLLTFADKNNHKLTYAFIYFSLFVQVFFGIQGTVSYVIYINKQSPPEIFKSSVPIITDQTARGILPRNLWYVHPDSPVYAAKQDSIINKFPDVRGYPIIYLISSVNDYGNSPEKQKEVLKLFENNCYAVKAIGKNIYIEGEIFELRKINGDTISNN